MGSVNERSELSEIGPLPVILLALTEILSCQCDGWEPMIQDLTLRCTHTFQVGISLQQIIPCGDLGLLLSDSLLTFKGTWKSHFFVKPNFQMLATSFTLYSPSHCAGEHAVSLSALD